MSNTADLTTPRDNSAPERLDKRYYLLSLASRLAGRGAIGEAELAALSDGLCALFAAQLERYTGGESSSVLAGTGEKLLRSLMYNADLALLRAGEAEAERRLTEASKAPARELERIYYEGLLLNRELQLKARSQLRAIRRELDKIAPEHRELGRLPGELERMLRGYDDKNDAACSVAVGYRMPTLGGGLRGVSGMLRLEGEVLSELKLVGALLPEVRVEVGILLRTDPDANLGECCLAASLAGELRRRGGQAEPELSRYADITDGGYLERLAPKAARTASILAGRR